MRSLCRAAAVGCAGIAVSAACLSADSLNLIVGRPVVVWNVSGDTAALSEPDLLPEGSDWRARPALVLRDQRSSIVIDLGDVKSLRAFLLQADHASSLRLDVSTDGMEWSPAWNVPPIYVGVGLPEMGIRTRTTELDASLSARWIRLVTVDSTGSSQPMAVVVRLAVFSTMPESWPPELDYSKPRSRPPLIPAIDVRAAGILYIFLSAAVLVLMTWTLAVQNTYESREQRRVRVVLLVLAIAVACLAWPNFLNFHWGSIYHPHEFYHYYLGAKYTREIAYQRLYDCTALADFEDGYSHQVASRQMRDLRNNQVIPASRAIDDPGRCKEFFEARRWEAFKEDIGWFRQRFPDFRAWNRTQLDHGFNATPAWMILGVPLATLAGPSDLFLSLLALIDLVLLGGAAFMLFRTFGLESTVIAVCFFCLNGIAFFRYTGGSFLRYDWFFLLVVAICAMQKNRGKLAGFALAYSAFLRIFPGFLLMGLALRGAWEVMAARSLRPLRRYRDLVLGALLAIILLVPASLVSAGRPTAWGEFAENSRKHLGSQAANFMGWNSLISIVFEDREQASVPETGVEGAEDDMARRLSPQVTARSVSVLGALGFVFLFLIASRGKAPWVVTILAIGFIPFLGTLSNYYFVVLSLYGVLWTVLPGAGYSLSFLAWFGWLPLALFENHLSEYAASSVVTLILVLVITVMLARNRLTEGCRD